MSEIGALRVHPSSGTAIPAYSGRPRVGIIGIGVQKAATTWLFKCLAEHPEIATATAPELRRKEVNFFNQHYERGFEWYNSLFEPGPRKNAEFSVLYFHDRNVPERVRRYNPDARLILSLRNPIDRAYSHHRHEVRKSRLPAELHDFRRAIVQNPSYIEQGLYATHLERWLQHFPRDQMHIVLYEDICRSPGAVLRSLFEFLSIDPDYLPSVASKPIHRVLVARRSRVVSDFIKATSRTVGKTLGAHVHALIRRSHAPAFVRKVNEVQVRDPDIPALSDADRRRLRDTFVQEIARTEELLGRDLAHWK